MNHFFITTLLFLVLLLNSCEFFGQADARLSVNEGPVYRTWDEYLESLDSDDVGKYKTIAVTKVEDDSGYSIGISERFYVELEKTRFVVEQKGKGLQSQSNRGLIKEMLFFVTQPNSEMTTQTINSANAPTQDFSGIVFATELSDAKSVDSVLAANRCGTLEINYLEGTFFPIKLDTCNSPSQ